MSEEDRRIYQQNEAHNSFDDEDDELSELSVSYCWHSLKIRILTKKMRKLKILGTEEGWETELFRRTLNRSLKAAICLRRKVIKRNHSNVIDWAIRNIYCMFIVSCETFPWGSCLFGEFILFLTLLLFLVFIFLLPFTPKIHFLSLHFPPIPFPPFLQSFSSVAFAECSPSFTIHHHHWLKILFPILHKASTL